MTLTAWIAFALAYTAVAAAPGPVARQAAPAPRGGTLRVLAHVWLTATLNPKAILFFVVFVPQFMNPAAPLAPQLAAMVVTILVCGTAVDTCYALFAARALAW